MKKAVFSALAVLALVLSFAGHQVSKQASVGDPISNSVGDPISNSVGDPISN